MRLLSIYALSLGILSVLAPGAEAQGRASVVALARLQPATDSSLQPRRTWAATGATVGAVGGGVTLAIAFYHFTHRSGAANNTSGMVGGTLVGVALGAAGGALLGAFVGSLFRKND